MSRILVIQPMHPLPYSSVDMPKDGRLPVSVHITLGCGCPACAGGRWDASRFRVVAVISENGMGRGDAALDCSGRISEFTGVLPVKNKGPHLIEISAIDPETGLAGRGCIRFKVI